MTNNASDFFSSVDSAGSLAVHESPQWTGRAITADTDTLTRAANFGAATVFALTSDDKDNRDRLPALSAMTVGDWMNCRVDSDSALYLFEDGDTNNDLEIAATPGAIFVIRVALDPAGNKMWHAIGQGLLRGPVMLGDWSDALTPTAIGTPTGSSQRTGGGLTMLSRTLGIVVWISSDNLYAAPINFDANGFTSKGTETLILNHANAISEPDVTPLTANTFAVHFSVATTGTSCFHVTESSGTLTPGAIATLINANYNTVLTRGGYWRISATAFGQYKAMGAVAHTLHTISGSTITINTPVTIGTQTNRYTPSGTPRPTPLVSNGNYATCYNVGHATATRSFEALIEVDGTGFSITNMFEHPASFTVALYGRDYPCHGWGPDDWMFMCKGITSLGRFTVAGLQEVSATMLEALTGSVGRDYSHTFSYRGLLAELSGTVRIGYIRSVVFPRSAFAGGTHQIGSYTTDDPYATTSHIQDRTNEPMYVHEGHDAPIGDLNLTDAVGIDMQATYYGGHQLGEIVSDDANIGFLHAFTAASPYKMFIRKFEIPKATAIL